jgi:hypothetical protein
VKKFSNLWVRMRFYLKFSELAKNGRGGLKMEKCLNPYKNEQLLREDNL